LNSASGELETDSVDMPEVAKVKAALAERFPGTGTPNVAEEEK